MPRLIHTDPTEKNSYSRSPQPEANTDASLHNPETNVSSERSVVDNSVNRHKRFDDLPTPNACFPRPLSKGLNVRTFSQMKDGTVLKMDVSRMQELQVMIEGNQYTKPVVNGASTIIFGHHRLPLTLLIL